MNTCPYCKQVPMQEGDDPRLICRCSSARQYRKTLDALDKASAEAAPMQEIDEGIMAELRTLAHYVCLRKITKATLNLADGSVVTIGAKVSRARRLKVEEKVDE